MEQKLSNSIGLFTIVLGMLCTAIIIVIWCVPLYEWSITWFNLTSVTHLSQAVLLENYRTLIHYLNFPWLSTLVFPNFSMSASGAHHFAEVKSLFLLVYTLWGLSIIGSWQYIQWVQRKCYIFWLYHALKRVAYSFIGVIMALVMFFDPLFVWFHQMLFNNEDWLFNPITDPVILALPEDFFTVCFITVVIIILIQLVGFTCWLKKERKSL